MQSETTTKTKEEEGKQGIGIIISRETAHSLRQTKERKKEEKETVALSSRADEREMCCNKKTTPKTNSCQE